VGLIVMTSTAPARAQDQYSTQYQGQYSGTQGTTPSPPAGCYPVGSWNTVCVDGSEPIAPAPDNIQPNSPDTRIWLVWTPAIGDIPANWSQWIYNSTTGEWALVVGLSAWR